MRVLVTGATGFFGSRLVRRLLEHTDHELVLLTRPGREAVLPVHERVRPAPGDLTDRASLERAARGCEAVIHTAALVSTWSRRRSDFDRVNVQGALDTFEAAARAGARKILYVSSFLALGHSDGPPLGEDDCHERPEHYNDYERTKYLANRLALRLARSGLPLVTLYPAVMYGPGPLTAGNLVVNLLRDYLLRHLPARLGDGSQRWNFVFVEDVARGVELALEKAGPGSRYILGGENASLAEFFRLTEELTGIPQPRLALPFPLARATGAVEEALAFLFGRTPRTTRGAIDIFRRNWVFDSSRAEKELGYRALGLREGLVRTIDWLKTEVLKEGRTPPEALK
jgi:NAD+-dependent farnesol dehydrogenase